MKYGHLTHAEHARAGALASSMTRFLHMIDRMGLAPDKAVTGVLEQRSTPGTQRGMQEAYTKQGWRWVSLNPNEGVGLVLQKVYPDGTTSDVHVVSYDDAHKWDWNTLLGVGDTISESEAAEIEDELT